MEGYQGQTPRYLLQFLIESTTISVIGGCIGILVGILAAYGIGDVVAQAMPGGGNWSAVVQPTAIILAFAVGVGEGFGLFPAMKASKLDPAEALRLSIELGEFSRVPLQNDVHHDH